jgi:glyoxylase-like metal-dependent hydrolase (beta-lactamase superfamily II)
VQSVEKRAAEKPELAPLLAADKAFYEQKKNVHLVFPNVTFTDRLALDLGERHIEVLNYGRGVTPGDTFVYLPKEKILLLGDLIVNPITFALSGFPTEWLHVLEKVDALDATTIVTGHGAPLHDKTLLHATMEVFRVLLREGKAAKARGLDPDQAKEAIFPGLHDLMVQITGDRPPLNDAFKSQLVDWYLHRVYEELDGPLTDAISKIPPT